VATICDVSPLNRVANASRSPGAAVVPAFTDQVGVPDRYPKSDLSPKLPSLLDAHASQPPFLLAGHRGEHMFYNPSRAPVARGAYRFASRPADAGHAHPLLVFDGQDRLHLPLTVFAREAARRLSTSSVRVYLYAVLPFFAFLDQTRSGADLAGSWTASPESIRHAVGEYMEDQLGCVIRRHRLGFELVSTTGGTRSNVGAFLAALKLFYFVMREVGCYTAENPLIDVTSRVLSGDADDDFDGDRSDPPRMPDISGVVLPRSRRRLTDSFFKLVGRDWVPQIIDDPTFPGLGFKRRTETARLGLTRRMRDAVTVRDRWPHFRGNRAHARGLGQSWVDEGGDSRLQGQSRSACEVLPLLDRHGDALTPLL
jgi:hypothetical protein